MSIAKMWKIKLSKISKFLLVTFLISSWLFSSWPQMMTYAVETGDTNKISKEEIKIKFDNSQLAGKYEMRGASFHKVVKSDKAEKTEVRIGNETTASFDAEDVIGKEIEDIEKAVK